MTTCAPTPIDSPFGKKLDGYEWILMTAGHSERHTKPDSGSEGRPEFSPRNNQEDTK